MKSMKKTIAALVAISMIFGCVVGGTIAWLTANSDTVTNTFTKSDVSVTLTETEGTLNGTHREFKMVPGMTIAKDPKVTVNADSEDCYVFVKIDENNMATTGDYPYFTYDVADGWDPLVDEDKDGIADNGVYYREVLKADTTKEFYVLAGANNYATGCVVVSGEVTKADMDKAENTAPTLTFTAYASQLYKTNDTTAANGGKFTAAEAWANVNA